MTKFGLYLDELFRLVSLEVVSSRRRTIKPRDTSPHEDATFIAPSPTVTNHKSHDSSISERAIWEKLVHKLSIINKNVNFEELSKSYLVSSFGNLRRREDFRISIEKQIFPPYMFIAGYLIKILSSRKYGWSQSSFRLWFANEVLPSPTTQLFFFFSPQSMLWLGARKIVQTRKPWAYHRCAWCRS